MSSKKGSKYIYAQKHKLYFCSVIILAGIEKIKTKNGEQNIIKTAWTPREIPSWIAFIFLTDTE